MRVTVRFREPTPIEALPIEWDDRPSRRHSVLDLRQRRVSRAELRNFILSFGAFFFHISKEDISVASDLYQDIERSYYALNDQTPLSAVKYHRLFVGSDGHGGIPDQGFAVFLFHEALADVLGIGEMKTEPEGAGIGAVLYSRTVGELIDAWFDLLELPMG